jgi:hypothetical protein
MSLLETFSLETKMNYHKDENGAHQTSIAIADILFNNPAITRAIERGLTPSATMARLFPLLAHTNTSFANAIYARTYMIDPNCAGREDKLIQEYLNHCNDEDLEKIVNTLYEGITHESGNTIADIIFKNSH